MENKNVMRIDSLIDQIRMRRALLEVKTPDGNADPLGKRVDDYLEGVIDELTYLRDTYGKE